MCLNFSTKTSAGTSLLVQCLRLYASNAGMQGAWVRSLVRELRSHMLGGEAKKNPNLLMVSGDFIKHFVHCKVPYTWKSYCYVAFIIKGSGQDRK